MRTNATFGIMQPYFFPYLGHFSLIAAVDEWVVFDVTQYTPKSWMNRNRILHPNGGWQYVTVPVSNSSISIRIREARVLNIAQAKTTILGKLSHYRKKARYFQAVTSLIDETFDAATDDSLVHLNVRALAAVCRYLSIPFSYRVCSELNLPLPPRPGPGGWAPEICRLLGASRYINPVSGRDLFDPAEFTSRSVSLQFARFKEFVYGVGPYRFEPNLSVLDVLMWNSPSVVADAVQSCAEISSGLAAE